MSKYRSFVPFAALATLAISHPASAAPPPNTPAISEISVGSTPPEQTSSTGGPGDDLTVTVDDGEIVGSTDGNPTIVISSTGGTGSTGLDGGASYGGAGGTGGQVSLEMNPGSGVVSGSTAQAAVLLNSSGGQGGTAGDQNGGDDAGQPGHGGDSASVLFGQAGSIVSTNGWNGSNPGTTAVLMLANGGDAAQPLDDASNEVGSGPAGGNGGQGGSITYQLYEGDVSSGGSAVVALSQGGQGGDGTQAENLSHAVGGKGGTGGIGGTIQIFTGQSGFTPPSITAMGASSAASGAVVPVGTTGDVAQAAMMAAGIQAQSVGGLGGYGGGAQATLANAGAGGDAGNGGLVQLSLQSTNITTSGFAAAGVLAQSIGGEGGDGATASPIIFGRSGKGGDGGDGGEVDVALWEPTALVPTATIQTSGDDSVGVVAQSIGGGGGAGGSIVASSILAGISIGGSGENGGVGGAVTLYNGYPIRVDGAPAYPGQVIYTQGERSSALVAQSIGGGGGLGGSAQNTVIGPFNYTVGGNGGSGGSAGTPGTVQVIGYNSGVVYTEGDHAKGLVAQAISGGGGDGGAATALTMNSEGATSVTYSVAVGGSGGSGSTSGDVQATNTGQIMTSGSDAWGMLAQSISGGGGNGGASKNDVYAMSASAEVPSLTFNVSTGGNGGTGANAGNVEASNSSVIMTNGASAHGILAQSISGGGGNAGNSSATSVVAGGSNIALTIAVGGNGGEGGAGGSVNVDNSQSGLIFVAGDNARGILAQSIGGSGGTATSGKSESWYVSAQGSSTASFSLGGGGGSGAVGGAVTVSNEGNILTMGDSGNGILAQSIGGGGGLAIAGSAKGDNGIKANRNFTVTGTGGGDANGGSVTVVNTANNGNTGNIVTYGGDAAAIYAQSVGGGGGHAGTGSTSGHAGATEDIAQFLLEQDVLATQAYGWPGVTGPQTGAGAGLTLAQIQALGQDYLDFAAAHPETTPDGGIANDTTVTMLVGGGYNDKVSTSASTPGDGGDVTVTNNATLQTYGPLSAGIWAQSVGGGGGHSGSSATENYQVTVNDTYKTNITVGGKNLSLGKGGVVTVKNLDGQIKTAGDASFGIYAQSVGAGGGSSAVTSNSYTSADGTPSALVLGGAGGTMGDGGEVDVTVQPSGNWDGRTTSIMTTGNDAVGIVAQSLGGGGGTLTLMQADSTGKSVTNPGADPTGQLVQFTMGDDTYTPPPHLGCPGSSQGYFYYSCGDGGAVNVTVDDALVSTTGRNAHGILAQSIGGGGGWVMGLTQNADSPYNANALMGGSGGDVTINLNGTILTNGYGAFGILAQSIGGGGVLGGDLAAAGDRMFFQGPTGSQGGLWGNGGDVSITLGSDGIVNTYGVNAHGIFAQSVAGGGGLYSTTGGLMLGSAHGTGDVGSISIDNSGTVQVWGDGASAVFTNTEGNKTPSVTITNEAGAQLIGTPTAPVILLSGTFSDSSIGEINNSGNILARNPNNSLAGATVISSGDGFADVVNLQGGAIYGNIQVNSGDMNNMAGAYWGTAASSSANVFNFGTLDVNGAADWAPTNSVITGNVTNVGTIRQSVDFYNNEATVLSIIGEANLGGTLLIDADTLVYRPVNTIFASDAETLSLDGMIAQDESNYLFMYSVQNNGPVVNVIPDSRLTLLAEINDFTANEQAVAAQLESGFDYGTLTAAQSASLAQINKGVTNAAQFAAALDNLSSEAAQVVSADSVGASQAFVERMNSCPQFDQQGTLTQEHDCVWLRYIDADADHDTTVDSVGYRSNGETMQLGAQREIAPDWFLGGSLAYDTTDLETRNVQGNVEGSGWTGGLIVKREMGDWLVSVALHGGRMSYDATRRLQAGNVDRIATSDFDVSHYGVHSRIARQFPFESAYLRPYVDLHATRFESSAYVEEGADDLNLKVNASSENVFSIAPMLEAGGRFDFGQKRVLRIYGALGGSFYSEDSVGADLQFAEGNPAQGTFRVNTDLPDQRFKAAAGLDLRAGDHLNVRLEYSGEFASHYDEQMQSLKVSYQY